LEFNNWPLGNHKITTNLKLLNKASYKFIKNIIFFRNIIILNHPIKNKKLIKRINSVNQNNIEVIGDNIEFSEDSNKFGLINNEKIIGIVTSKLIFPKLKNFLIQKNRSTSLNPK